MRALSILSAGAFLLASLFANPAAAADYPDRTITLVVPYAPGGSSDIVGRLYAQALETRLGGRVVVENVPGAGGSIGAQRAAGAAPDGYTLFVGAGSELFIFGELNPKPAYEATRDFRPIGLLGVGPMVVVSRPDLPATTFSEMTTLAKADGSAGLTYGSAGIGTFMHLVGAAIDSTGRLGMEHVPYRGAGPLIVDVIGSQVDIGVSSLAAALPFLQSGQARALAVTSPHPSPLAPGIPTLAEQPGLNGFSLELWIGLFAPSGTSSDILARLEAATQEIQADPDLGRKLADQGLIARPDLKGDELAAFLQSQAALYRRIIADAGITAQ